MNAESKSARSTSLNGANIDLLSLPKDNNDKKTRLISKERSKSPSTKQQPNDLEDDDTMNHIDFNDSSSKNEDSSEKAHNNNVLDTN